MKKIIGLSIGLLISFSVFADFTGESTQLGKITKIGIQDDVFYIGFEVRPNACKNDDWLGYHAKIFKTDDSFDVIVSIATAAYFSKQPTVQRIRWDSILQGEKTCADHSLHINSLLFN